MSVCAIVFPSMENDQGFILFNVTFYWIKLLKTDRHRPSIRTECNLF